MKGFSGARRAKQWLEGTMRIFGTYANTDSESYGRPASVLAVRRPPGWGCVSADDRVKEQDGACARRPASEKCSSWAAAVAGCEHACNEPGKCAQNEHDGSSLTQKRTLLLAVHIYSDRSRRRHSVCIAGIPVLML
ncbi:hypothetical protein GCM10023084_71570 [Streptomyces lacrimifluminis]|uniref:Uncharacterized protein n=1 Tax=Streptomyces lacrimifluminis TaxID=1500077 RepID=A0A917P8C7_9ACTN|nr:hypothetical protein GCM10012282_74170 [Streptomyces lacrimifluminis]